jgi:rhodanese-related sulfurtransferase
LGDWVILKKIKYMFIKKIVLFFSFLVVTASAFSQVQNRAFRQMLKGLLSHSVPEVTAMDAAKDSSRTLFMDARDWREYEVSHINNAMFAGYDDFEISFMEDIPKNQKIVVYCSVGYRSEKITERIRAAGFKNVSNMVGGIFDWVNRDLPVFNETGKTVKVHPYDKVWGVWLKKGEKVY